MTKCASMRRSATGMSKRRRRRQRGKRKEARRQELKDQAVTWDKLANGIDTKPKQDFARVLLPLIRNLTPNLMANDIVGVQPMAGPDLDRSLKWDFKHEYYNSKQKKKERKAQRRAAKQEKRARRIMEKIMRNLTAQK